MYAVWLCCVKQQKQLLFDLHSQILTVKGCEIYGYCHPNTRYCSCYFTILEQIVTLRGLYALSSNIILAENGLDVNSHTSFNFLTPSPSPKYLTHNTSVMLFSSLLFLLISFPCFAWEMSILFLIIRQL